MGGDNRYVESVFICQPICFSSTICVTRQTDNQNTFQLIVSIDKCLVGFFASFFIGVISCM